MELCEVCEKKEIKYKLKSKKPVRCPYDDCRYLKYNRGLELNICSTQCEELYCWPEKYLSKKDDPICKVTFCFEKDECNQCGRRDYPSVLFEGPKVVYNNVRSGAKSK